MEERTVHTMDASGMAVGRLASEIAHILMGKHNPAYQAHIAMGDAVTVTNVAKMTFSGKKLDQKVYHRNTGYPSGIRTETAKDLMQTNPEKVLKNAVEHMLPDTKLRNELMKRLTIE